jgi:hypothetical protein
MGAFKTIAAASLLIGTVPAWAVPMQDATGDTFGVGPVQLDISSINAVFTASDIKFTVRLSTPVSAPSAGLANSVFAFIDIDTDQDPLTGLTSLQSLNSPSPSSGLGTEFFIVFGSELDNPGFVDVFDRLTNTFVGAVPVVYGPMSFVTVVPLAMLGNDDGWVNYGTVIGTLSEPTDEASDSGIPAVSSPVPEPMAAVFGVMSLGALCHALRRHRAV